jgi:hypothetical protein
MFPWSKKNSKSVTFNSEVADETLLAVVETELLKQPHKTFSDLCKEALWQFLCVPESVRPTPKITQGEQGVTDRQVVAELQRQLADFEQRFLTRESSRWEAIERQMLGNVEQRSLAQETNGLETLERQLMADFEQRLLAKQASRLDAIERQLNQLSQQLTQLSLIVKQQPPLAPPSQVATEVEAVTVTPTPAPEIDDPLLSRISALIDDF